MDISMVKGDAKSWRFTVLDHVETQRLGRDAPYQLTSISTARFTVDALDGSDMFQKTIGSGITVLNQVTDPGALVVKLANADTASLTLPAGLAGLPLFTFEWVFPYDLQIVLSGDPITVARGSLRIAQERTAQNT